jgi:hypothetical protein
MIKTCKRCGLCCANFPHCGHGNEKGKHGMCSFLVIGKNITSCKLMLQGKIKPDNKGCVLKRVELLDKSTQEYFREMRNNWKGILP